MKFTAPNSLKSDYIQSDFVTIHPTTPSFDSDPSLYSELKLDLVGDGRADTVVQIC